MITWEARTRRRAGDAAARASGRVRPRGSHVGFFDSRRREPIRLRLAPTRADSGRLGPESAGIGRYRQESAGIGRYRPESAGIGRNGRNSRFRPKFKKKKNPERTVFTEIQNTLFTLRLTHFVSVLVCSLPLCLSVSSPSLPHYCS